MNIITYNPAESVCNLVQCFSMYIMYSNVCDIMLRHAVIFMVSNSNSRNVSALNCLQK